MNKILTIIVGLILLIVFIVLFYVFYKKIKNQNSDNYTIIDGTVNASKGLIVKGNKIKRSYDGEYGMEFTYAFWIYIDELNVTNRFGHILTKGSSNINYKATKINDLSVAQAPGIWLDKNINNLIILMNTIDNTNNTLFEKCEIENIPMKNWVHITISLINNNLDIYLNGEFKKRVVFKGIPKLNYGDLLVTQNNPFLGNISNLKYFNHAVKPYEINNMINEGPSQLVSKSPDFDYNDYLAQNWYFKTFNQS